MTTMINNKRLNRRKVSVSGNDRVFYIFVYTFVITLTLFVLYPVIYVLSASFSKPAALISGKVVLLPVDFTLNGYIKVFENPRVLIGYRNSLFYTVVGTAINVFMTLICAYPLSRKDLPFNKTIMYLFTFTMLFSGGLIPTYLVVRDLRLINKVWALLIPGAISVYQMIVTRTFILYTIPDEIFEAAYIDGCDDFRYFFMFIIPLSKAVIAVIALQYAVGHWNSYFSAFIYLNSKNLYPLQVFLREILVLSQIPMDEIVDPETAIAIQGMADCSSILSLLSQLYRFCAYTPSFRSIL